jgi:phospholipid/cholesterol/gamma-HCH transport system substrate-binding protein
MNDQSMKFRLGIFVLGAAVLLAVLIVLFGDLPDIFRGQFHYTIRFAQAPGLETGSPVRKSGIRIGEVTNYTLDPESGLVTVHVVVDRKYQLRKGDQPGLGRGILGDSNINFAPVTEPKQPSDREPAPSGYVFEGKSSDVLTRIGAAAQDLVPASQAAVDELRELSKRMSELIPDFKRTMQEAQVAMNKVGNAAESADNLLRTNSDRMSKTLDNVSNASENLSNLITPNMTRRIDNILLNAETVSAQMAALLNDENRRNATEFLKSARTATDRVAAAITDENVQNVTATLRSMREASVSVNNTLKNLDTGVTDARKLMNNVDGGVTEARKTMNNVSPKLETLTTDASAAMKRLGTSAEKLDAALTDIRSFTKELGERGPGMIRNIDDASARMGQVAVDLGSFTKSLAQGDGTIRRLVMDPDLYNSLNAAAASAAKGVTRFDRILYDLSIFSDKLARHPELLGVSGAVAPSSGIKR